MRNSTILGFVGGFLIVINAAISTIVSGFGWVFVSGIPSDLLLSLYLLSLIAGVVVLLGAYMSMTSRTAERGAILMVFFSIIAFFGGGGFILGSILAIIGGGLILAKRD